jgi:oligopeptide/dipeptide ABC transporter ATP-binding protein
MNEMTPSGNSHPGDVLLEVKDLCVEFHVQKGIAKVLKNLDFKVCKNETLGIVGESGCGKSMTALAILGMVPVPPGKISSGSITYKGRDLLKAGKKEMRKIRGNNITMIFQEPMTSLNPVYPVGEQIAETLRFHENMGRKKAHETAVEMLDTVAIPSPDKVARQYPYQLSGGMRQRVSIAMALACSPDLLIADEPTTALDVTVQAQILELLRNIQKEKKTAIIFITHDMGVIANMANRVIVMYAGYKVEQGDVRDIMDNPLHPYTKGLMACVPHLDPNLEGEPPMLKDIPGIVPSPISHGGRCAFAPRCSFAMERCHKEEPIFDSLTEHHGAACWLLSQGT